MRGLLVKRPIAMLSRIRALPVHNAKLGIAMIGLRRNMLSLDLNGRGAGVDQPGAGGR